MISGIEGVSSAATLTHVRGTERTGNVRDVTMLEDASH